MTSSPTCCHNLLPPPSRDSNSISPPKLWAPPLIASRQDERGSWRAKCLVSLACAAVGLLEPTNLVMCHEMPDVRAPSAVLERSAETPRWSDRRSCPPWETNSLEIVVPENLPRPSARRKWDSVGLSKAVPTAAAMVKRKTDCFSM